MDEASNPFLYPRRSTEMVQPEVTQFDPFRRHGFLALASNSTDPSSGSWPSALDQPPLWDNTDTGRGASLGDLQQQPIHLSSGSEPPIELLDSAITDDMIDQFFE